MASASPPTDPDTGDGGQQTITIVVAVAAGTLMMVVLLLCIIVAYLYFRKDRIAEKTPTVEVDNRHRLFQEPANISSKFEDILELGGLEESIFQQDNAGSTAERKKKKKPSSKTEVEVEKENTRSNPTFGKDDLYADALESDSKNRRPRPQTASGESSGIVNHAVDISDERDSPRSGDEVNREEPSQTIPDGPSDSSLPPKLDILNPDTWKDINVEGGESTEITKGDIVEGNDDTDSPRSDEEIPTHDGGMPVSDNEETANTAVAGDEDAGALTISSANLDVGTDNIDDVTDDVIEEGEEGEDEKDTYYMYSPFQRTNSKRRRSFQTRNSAIIDFYERGDLERVRQTEGEAPRINSGIDMDTFWDGFRAPVNDNSAQGLLWQNKRIF